MTKTNSSFFVPLIITSVRKSRRPIDAFMMMMAPEYYTFTGRANEVIPRHVTHVLIDKALKSVTVRAFWCHPNIQEVICHDGVEKIEGFAFYKCYSLRRVIMPGVKVINRYAFEQCGALTYIECGKLETIGDRAFQICESLRSIQLPSIKIIERWAFNHCCINMANVKFGKELESIREGAFWGCTSLERIALPLKDGMVIDDTTFQMCEKLNHVDLVEGAVLHETIAALLMEEWKNDMNAEIDSINQNLASARAGTGRIGDVGEKAQAIRTWITSVLRKITHYKAEHRRILSEATAILQPALPNDILFKNVLPFLELPSFTFDGEDYGIPQLVTHIPALSINDL